MLHGVRRCLLQGADSRRGVAGGAAIDHDQLPIPVHLRADAREGKRELLGGRLRSNEDADFHAAAKNSPCANRHHAQLRRSPSANVTGGW